MSALEESADLELTSRVLRASKAEIGEQQRLPLNQKANRLTKDKRMSIRRLYALEKRIAIIAETIEEMKRWKIVDGGDTPAGSTDNKKTANEPPEGMKVD